MKLLLAVDGSEHALRAAQYVVALRAQLNSPPTVLVLNVQPPVASGLVRRFLSQDALDGYYRDEARGALEPVENVLAQNDVTTESHVVVGDIAASIAEFATRHGCDPIVMGTRGVGGVKGALLGSVASEVLHLADRPVLLVK